MKKTADDAAVCKSMKHYIKEDGTDKPPQCLTPEGKALPKGLAHLGNPEHRCDASDRKQHKYLMDTYRPSKK